MADSTIRIVIIDPYEERRTTLEKLLTIEVDFEVFAAFNTSDQSRATLVQYQPDIVLLAHNPSDRNGFAIITDMRAVYPMMQFIIMGANNDIESLRTAMLSGAGSWITLPFQLEAVLNEVRKVASLSESEAGGKRLPPQKITHDPGDKPGKVIVCYSPNGGVGTTTLATNIAVGLQKAQHKVLLVDGKLQFGTVSTFLNLPNNRQSVSLLTAFEHEPQSDVPKLVEQLPKHATGVRVLYGSHRPEVTEVLQTQVNVVFERIDIVRQQFDYTVIDTSTEINELNMSLFEIADQIVLLTTPSLAAMQNVRAVIDLLTLMDTDYDKRLKLVVIQSQREQKELSVEKITSFLKIEITETIRFHPDEFGKAIIQGSPILAGSNRSESPAKELNNLMLNLLAAMD